MHNTTRHPAHPARPPLCNLNLSSNHAITLPPPPCSMQRSSSSSSRQLARTFLLPNHEYEQAHVWVTTRKSHAPPQV